MHSLDPLTHLYVEIGIGLLTCFILPFFLWLMQSRFTRAHEIKVKAEDERHQNVLKKIEEVLIKVKDFCATNRTEHNELFTARRQLEKNIEAINTIHHQRGCDQPYTIRE